MIFTGRKLKIWLWVSVVMAVMGALMLYPIGTGAADCIFILVKIGMVTGLMILIVSGKTGGYCTWATCSCGAVIMTIIKCSLSGSVTFLSMASIFVDIFLPVMVYRIRKQEKSKD